MSGDAFNLPVHASLLDHPVLKTDPKYAALKGDGIQFHSYGWPAPATDKVQPSPTRGSSPNMIAKAVTGTSNKEAMAWAENEMKQILAGRPWPSAPSASAPRRAPRGRRPATRLAGPRAGAGPGASSPRRSCSSGSSSPIPSA